MNFLKQDSCVQSLVTEINKISLQSKYYELDTYLKDGCAERNFINKLRNNHQRVEMSIINGNVCIFAKRGCCCMYAEYLLTENKIEQIVNVFREGETHCIDQFYDYAMLKGEPYNEHKHCLKIDY